MNFPANPNPGDTFQGWTWDGEMWLRPGGGGGGGGINLSTALVDDWMPSGLTLTPDPLTSTGTLSVDYTVVPTLIEGAYNEFKSPASFAGTVFSTGGITDMSGRLTVSDASMMGIMCAVQWSYVSTALNWTAGMPMGGAANQWSIRGPNNNAFLALNPDGSGSIGPNATNCLSWNSAGIFSLLGTATLPGGSGGGGGDVTQAGNNSFTGTNTFNFSGAGAGTFKLLNPNNGSMQKAIIQFQSGVGAVWSAGVEALTPNVWQLTNSANGFLMSCASTGGALTVGSISPAIGGKLILQGTGSTGPSLSLLNNSGSGWNLSMQPSLPWVLQLFGPYYGLGLSFQDAAPPTPGTVSLWGANVNITGSLTASKALAGASITAGAYQLTTGYATYNGFDGSTLNYVIDLTYGSDFTVDLSQADWDIQSWEEANSVDVGTSSPGVYIQLNGTSYFSSVLPVRIRIQTGWTYYCWLIGVYTDAQMINWTSGPGLMGSLGWMDIWDIVFNGGTGTGIWVTGPTVPPPPPWGTQQESLTSFLQVYGGGPGYGGRIQMFDMGVVGSPPLIVFNAPTGGPQWVMGTQQTPNTAKFTFLAGSTGGTPNVNLIADSAAGGSLTLGTATYPNKLTVNLPNQTLPSNTQGALFAGSATALRLTATTTQALLEATDQTGAGSFQPLYLGGSTVSFCTGGAANQRATINAAGDFIINAAAPSTFFANGTVYLNDQGLRFSPAGFATFSSNVTFNGSQLFAPNLAASTQPSANVTYSQVDGFRYLPSALRFKTDVRSIPREAARSMIEKLRPVFYKSLCKGDDPDRDNVGLIAEEVAAVCPYAVAYDADGEPFSVDYNRIAVLLLAAN